MSSLRLLVSLSTIGVGAAMLASACSAPDLASSNFACRTDADCAGGKLCQALNGTGAKACVVPSDGGPLGPVTCSTPIKLNLQADFSSAIKAWSIPTFLGFYDYLREQNEAGAAPGGCKYDMVLRNNSYQAARAETIYREWQADPARFKDVLMVLNAGTPDTNQLAPFTLTDKKLHFTGSSAARFTSPVNLDGKTVQVPRLNESFSAFEEPTLVGKATGYPSLYFAGTDYTTGARLNAKLAAELGAKRVGYVNCTTSIYCTDPIPAARLAAAAVSLLPGRSLTIELADTQEQIIDKVKVFLKAEQDRKVVEAAYVPVDWIWMGNTSKTSAFFVNAVAIALKELNWTFAKPPIMINGAGFDEDLFKLTSDACLALTDAARRTACSTAYADLKVYGVVAFTPYGEQAAFMPAVEALHNKWREKDIPLAAAGSDPLLADTKYLPEADKPQKNVRYVQGYATGLLFDNAVRKTLLRGKPVTVDNVRETLDATQNEGLGGLVPYPLSFSSKDHRPQQGALIYTIDSAGKLQRPAISQNPLPALDTAEVGW
jgi:hypothetical protein